MSTTFIDFVPSLVQVPTFQITLDGNIYTVSVTWNLFAQRYYINITALSGELVLCEALVGSPVGSPIASLYWGNGIVTVVTTGLHFYSVGQNLSLTVDGANPSGYNGKQNMLVTGPRSLTFSRAQDPGAATVCGTLQNNINLVAGLFTSSLVYRQANRQFEVT